MKADRIASEYFLRDDNRYGCAETAYLTLKTIFGMDSPDDSSAAMVLNGGFAYSGGTCGALTGAAMALGELASKYLREHGEAKRTARNIMISVMEKFRERYKSAECADLIPYEISIPSEHDRFIASGLWRSLCLEQIIFVADILSLLADPEVWSSGNPETAIEKTGGIE